MMPRLVTFRIRWPIHLRLAWAYVDLWQQWVLVKCLIIPCSKLRAWWRARKVPQLQRELAAVEAEIAKRKRMGMWTLSDDFCEPQVGHVTGNCEKQGEPK